MAKWAHIGYHIGLPATFYTPKPPSNIHPQFHLNVGELQISSSINAMKFLRAIGDKSLQILYILPIQTSPILPTCWDQYDPLFEYKISPNFDNHQ